LAVTDVNTLAKAHLPRSVGYDSLFVLPFAPYTPGGTVANSVICSVLSLPVACKIFAVSIVTTEATHPTYLTNFNVIWGTAADGTPSNPAGSAGTAHVTGDAMAATDFAITTAQDVPQTFFPDVWDAYWPQNTELTLRLVVATGAIAVVNVSLLCAAFDINPRSTVTTWSPTQDIL
jgi:hypothetical protein